MSNLLKEAIADAKAVRETALENAKAALEEAFTPRLQSMLSQKLKEDEYEEDDSVEEEDSEDDKPLEVDVEDISLSDRNSSTGIDSTNSFCCSLLTKVLSFSSAKPFQYFFAFFILYKSLNLY